MYILHTRPDSAATIVRLVLEELGQPYQTRLVDGDLPDSPAYRRLQPFGLVPALETPDGPMFETGAILLWLADRHGALAPAAGDPGRAAFLAWLFVTSNAVQQALLQVFYPARTAGPDCTDAVQRHAGDRLRDLLARIEAMAVADAPDWLRADKPSVLGYYLAVLMRWVGGLPAGHPGRIDLAATPALRGVLAALEQRAATRAVAAAEGLGPRPFTDPTAA